MELNLLQSAIMKTIPDTKHGDIKFVNTMLQILFGRDILLQSSVTGTSKSGNGSTTKLDEKKINYIRGN